VRPECTTFLNETDGTGRAGPEVNRQILTETNHRIMRFR